MYAIMTTVPRDVGMFIYSTMLRRAYHRISGLWLPSLITTLYPLLCIGMIMETDMEIMPAGGYTIPIHQ